MPIQSARRPMRHTQKRYKAYLLESEATNQSIISKYGAPPKAHCPQLPEDIIEKVISQTYVTKEMWTGSKYAISRRD